MAIKAAHYKDIFFLFILVDYQTGSWKRIIKLFSCSTKLSMKFVLQINLKLLTSANYFLVNTAEHENFPANKYENANYCWHFYIY